MFRAVGKSLLVAGTQSHKLPQTLIFFVTSRCNARCDFCLYFDQVSNPVAKEKELSISEIEKISRNYGPLNSLALSGGETCVRRDMSQICSAFVRNCKTSVIDIP